MRVSEHRIRDAVLAGYLLIELNARHHLWAEVLRAPLGFVYLLCAMPLFVLLRCHRLISGDCKNKATQHRTKKTIKKALESTNDRIQSILVTPRYRSGIEFVDLARSMQESKLLKMRKIKYYSIL